MVGIDEVQFFDDAIVGVVKELVFRGVRVSRRDHHVVPRTKRLTDCSL